MATEMLKQAEGYKAKAMEAKKWNYFQSCSIT
jgi:hypothetical protein